MLLISITLGQVVSQPADLLDRLREADHAPHEVAWAARYDVKPFDPQQGRETRRCEAALYAEPAKRSGWVCHVEQDTPPNWAAPGTRGWTAADFEFSGKGRLIVFTVSRIVGVLSDEEAWSLRTVDRHAVSRSPTLYTGLAIPPTQTLYERPPGAIDQHPTLWQSRMALGRGYSDFMDSIVRVEDSGGTWIVHAKGPRGYGTWRIVLTKEALIAREAEFHGEHGTVWTASTVGARGGYAASGSLDLRRGRPIHATVEFVDSSMSSGFLAVAESTLKGTTPDQTYPLSRGGD